jgi:IS605 OrfB family transposase
LAEHNLRRDLRMQITIRGKLFPSSEQARRLDELMRLQSSCMRYAYNRLCEGKSKSEIEADLGEKFSEINSRYYRDGYFRAKANHESALELVKTKELELPERVVFGGRKNLKRRERREISNEEWKRLRNNQLYSRGDRSKRGNLNLRLVERGGELCLRVNVGNREWVHIPAYLPDHVDKISGGETPYGVRVLRKNGGYELRVSFEADHEPKVGFERGAVGVDFNHPTIDLAVTNEQGQLKTTRTIECHALTSAKREKREWLVGNLAKRVVDFANYWHRGLVIERLVDVARGRRNQHEFVHHRFLEAVKRRAEHEGVAVRGVNPAYTSVIGQHKYAPYYRITIHQAAALVVARRGQGFSERLHGLKSLLFEPSEGGEGNEGAPSRRVHSWSLWRRMRDLPSRKGTDYTHPGQSHETIGVESPGTIGPTERSLSGDDTPGREIASPGSGPPTQKEVAA